MTRLRERSGENKKPGVETYARFFSAIIGASAHARPHLVPQGLPASGGFTRQA
jgi:hypothetical protein